MRNDNFSFSRNANEFWIAIAYKSLGDVYKNYSYISNHSSSVQDESYSFYTSRSKVYYIITEVIRQNCTWDKLRWELPQAVMPCG